MEIKHVKTYKGVLLVMAIAVGGCQLYQTSPNPEGFAQGQLGVIPNKVSYKDITVSGTPYTVSTDRESYLPTSTSASGKPATIIAFPKEDANLISVGWVDLSSSGSTQDIHITDINVSSGSVVKDIKYTIPKKASEREGGFLNFCLLPNGEYALAYSDFTTTNRNGGECVLVKLSSSGAKVWEQRNLLGVTDGEDGVYFPGKSSSGSARMLYFATGNMIAYHSSIRGSTGHQASMFSLIDATTGRLYKNEKMYDKATNVGVPRPVPDPSPGTPDQAPDSGYPTFTFSISHNFDQRLIFDPSTSGFVALALGDAYPRAVPMIFIDKGQKKSLRVNLFQIQGKAGDNITRTQLGGLVQTNKGFAASFVTDTNRLSFDVGVSYVNNRVLANTVWLTGNNTDIAAIHPKATNVGRNTLVMWKEVKLATPKQKIPRAAIIDDSGTVLYGPDTLDENNVWLNPSDDFFTYKDGSAGWVVGNGTGKMRLYRLETP